MPSTSSIDQERTAIRVLSANEFSVGLVESDRDAVEAAIDELVTNGLWKPVTRDELLNRLEPVLSSFLASLGSDQ